MTEEKLLRLADVAEQLQKSERTIRRMVELGVIPAHRFPETRGLYFRWSEVLAALEPVEPEEGDAGAE